MKITVYTINDCPFCKQEKDYLSTNKMTFEEKNLESNKEFLTEMLAISNNFAGTPVTKIEKDDGQVAVLKGFTKEEFDKTLGLESVMPMGGDKPIAETNAQVAVPQPAAPPQAPTTPPPPIETPQPIKPNEEPKKSEPMPMTAEQKPTEQVAGTPDPLDAILNDLKTKAGEETKPAEKPTVPKDEPLPPTTPPATTPPPNQNLSGTPTIPDFQAK